jgi:hypothetical protein
VPVFGNPPVTPRPCPSAQTPPWPPCPSQQPALAPPTAPDPTPPLVDEPLTLKPRSFCFGTWNMSGLTHAASGSSTFARAADLISLERLDILALQETHCGPPGPPPSRRTTTLSHSGLSTLAAGIALITHPSSSWTCEISHDLVPSHASLSQLLHRVSTETVWVLCVYADSSRLSAFYGALLTALLSTLQHYPVSSWHGCVALGDWNLVEHPADCSPPLPPSPEKKRTLRAFDIIMGLCHSSDSAGPQPFPQGISFHHRALQYSAHLDRIYIPMDSCSCDPPITIPTLWSNHSLVWSSIYITKPCVELAVAAPCLPKIDTLDSCPGFWSCDVIPAYRHLVASPISLTSWVSFKRTILAAGCRAKNSHRASKTVNWKSILRGDAIPDDDVIDAICHSTFSTPFAPPRQRHTHRWPSAVPDLPPSPSPPPASSCWRSALTPTPSQPAPSPRTSPTPLPCIWDLDVDPTSHKQRSRIANYVSMRADKQHAAMRKKYTDMADTRSSAWFKLSSNKEADERGSRASISVEGLCLSTDDPATTRLAGMCAIAHNYFHKLHTPEPASGPRSSPRSPCSAKSRLSTAPSPAPPPPCPAPSCSQNPASSPARCPTPLQDPTAYTTPSGKP